MFKSRFSSSVVIQESETNYVHFELRLGPIIKINKSACYSASNELTNLSVATYSQKVKNLILLKTCGFFL